MSTIWIVVRKMNAARNGNVKNGAPLEDFHATTFTTAVILMGRHVTAGCSAWWWPSADLFWGAAIAGEVVEFLERDKSDLAQDLNDGLG
ncbi:hypothetical protein FTO74_10555 [Granulicella sp. WH15]|uniref:hypothetical protein n=1 Tax=Granulicella sp. WH15 TaxID=2602070 RepID=UPI001366C613|nr:hypothetical protein [Granulicella sp. WH15]QHN03762.1 hypothetical protein FTO74_10555 [Granulicella sp. WH15]